MFDSPMSSPLPNSQPTEMVGFLNDASAEKPKRRASDLTAPTKTAPRVLLAILAKQKQAMLPFYLACIDALDYPKQSIVLYVRTNNNKDRTAETLREWVGRVGHLYADVLFDALDVPESVHDFDVHEWNSIRFKILGNIRQASLAATLQTSCDFYFVADVDNFILPGTLKELVAANLPIVAPLLRYHDNAAHYSNYHEKIDQNGYFADSEEYYTLLFQRVKGLCQVPVVHCTYLVRRDAIPHLTYDDGTGRYEYVVFSDSARRNGIAQYLDTRQVYGYLTLDDEFGGAVRRLGGTVARAARKADRAAARLRSPSPGRAQAASARPAARGRTSAVFLHSSWRTSSTWLWSKFRDSQEALCFYEPFHHFLRTASVDQALAVDAQSWPSRHPQAPSYYLEYVPLFRRGGGIRLSHEGFASTWFVPSGGLSGELRREERRYVALLLREAERRGRVAVLGFTRSLGRSWALKQAFGGFHIFLHRNLWKQWASYQDYKRRGETFFCDTVPLLVNRTDDPFLAYLAANYLARSPAAASSNDGGAALIGTATAHEALAALGSDDAFALFMGLHLYLYLHAQTAADLIVDVSRLARDDDYRSASEAAIARAARLSVSLADASDACCSSAASLATAGIDWDRIRDHARVAAEMLAGLGDPRQLMESAERFVAAAQETSRSSGDLITA